MNPRRKNTRHRSQRKGQDRSPLLRRAAVLLLLLLLGFAALTLVRRDSLPDAAEELAFRFEQWLEQTLDDFGIRVAGRPVSERPVEALPRMADDHDAAAQALSLFERITVEPERRAGYVREDWSHWLDPDGDCRNTRHEILAAESLKAVAWSENGCSVQSGEWRDAYTDQILHSPVEIDVDHFVPLAEAHRSGGYAWSRERRAVFANDMRDDRTLIAVSASANRAKGDQGPEDWLPPVAAYHCRYVADWVAVKLRWTLSMDERERVTVGNLLRDCTAR